MSCAMVTGKPMPGMTVVGILTRNVLTRPGDRMTSDGESCYIFLNACPQSEIVVTLEQILGMAVDAAFDDPKLFIHREEIQPELIVLLRVSGHSPSPDDLPKNASYSVQEKIASGNTPEKPLFASMAHSEKSAASATLSSESASFFRPPVASQLRTTQSQIPAQAQTVPFIAVASALVAPVKDSINEPAGPRTLPDASSEEPLFSYDSASNAAAFGKKEVPRATRSVSK